MGATGRAGARQRQLSLAANRSGEFIARSSRRLAGKSIVRSDILVKLAGSEWPRGGFRTNARFALAKRAVERGLYLQGCAARHGRRAGIPLSAPVHSSDVKGDHCAAGIGSKIFGCAFPAAGARSCPIIHASFDLVARLANGQTLCNAIPRM